MRILILGGAGLMSAGTARDLLSTLSSGISKVTAADSSAERLAALKKSLADPRLHTQVFDVRDKAAMLSLLTDCDLCINGVPTFAGFQMAIFDACLEAKRTYVDYGGMGVYTVQQKAQHEKWQKAGVSAVVGLGADPGMSNIICRAVRSMTPCWLAGAGSVVGSRFSPKLCEIRANIKSFAPNR